MRWGGSHASNSLAQQRPMAAHSPADITDGGKKLPNMRFPCNPSPLTPDFQSCRTLSRSWRPCGRHWQRRAAGRSEQVRRLGGKGWHGSGRAAIQHATATGANTM